MEFAYQEIAQITRDLFLKMGSELFRDKTRLKAVMADLLPMYPRESRLLALAIDLGIPYKIVQEKNALSPADYYSMVKMLTDAFAMDADASEYVVSVYEYAIHGVSIEKEKANIPHKTTVQQSSGLSQSHQKKLKPATLATIVALLTIACVVIIIFVQKGKNDTEPHNYEASNSNQPVGAFSSNTTAPSISVDSFKTATVGSEITFGKYEQSGGISNGEEDIEWLVLARENDRILVISKRILGRITYDSQGGYYAPAWDDSAVRMWLNSAFVNGAFSEEEQRHIITVTVENDVRNSQDKVFLLNATEAREFFKSDASRCCEATAFVYSNDAWDAGRAWEFDDYDELSDYGRNCWLLRAEGSFADVAAYVDSNGEICEAYGNGLGDYINGVRPAMWIDLS